MNKVVLVGRLTKDPEIRYTQSGIAVATFTLAGWIGQTGLPKEDDGQVSLFGMMMDESDT